MKFMTSLLLGLACAQAQAAADYIADFNSAATELRQLVQQGEASKQLPQLSDPKVAELFARMANLNTTLAREPAGRHELQELLPACNQGAPLLSRYMKADAAKRYHYQNEVAGMVDISVRCFGHLLPVLNDTATLAELDNPQARQGVTQVRTGTLYIFGGGFMMLVDNKIGLPARQRIAAALADSAPAYTMAMTQQQREELLSLASNARTIVGKELKTELDRIIAALGNTECTGLCKL